MSSTKQEHLVRLVIAAALGVFVPIIKFEGKVFPSSVQLSFETTIRNQVTIPPPLNIAMELALSIRESNLTLECQIEKFSMQFFDPIYMRVLVSCRSIVDVVAFYHGVGLTTVLEWFTDDEGRRLGIGTVHAALKAIPTAYAGAIHPGNPIDIQQFVLRDHRLAILLHDLIEAATMPLGLRRNCARAVDGIRRLIDGGANEKRAWRTMQNALRVDEGYLQFISNHGKGERHGDFSDLARGVADELLQRSWTVMNRYFEYLKRGGTMPLPESTFPLLKG